MSSSGYPKPCQAKHGFFQYNAHQTSHRIVNGPTKSWAAVAEFDLNFYSVIVAKYSKSHEFWIMVTSLTATQKRGFVFGLADRKSEVSQQVSLGLQLDRDKPEALAEGSRL